MGDLSTPSGSPEQPCLPPRPASACAGGDGLLSEPRLGLLQPCAETHPPWCAFVSKMLLKVCGSYKACGKGEGDKEVKPRALPLRCRMASTTSGHAGQWTLRTAAFEPNAFI